MIGNTSSNIRASSRRNAGLPSRPKNNSMESKFVVKFSVKNGWPLARLYHPQAVFSISLN